LSPVHLPRLVDALLADLFAEVPAILIAGPRASGKTTSATRLSSNTLRLDRTDQAAAARADVDIAVSSPTSLLIDEWQFVPEILGAVKRAVDDDNSPGRFVITGSAAADLGSAGWAMAGRVVKVNMWGLTERELTGSTERSSIIDRLFSGVATEITDPAEPLDLRAYIDRSLRGMLPAVALSSSDRSRNPVLSSYLDQITMRDISGLSTSHDARLVRKYLAVVAANTAGIPDHKAMYDAAGIDRNTAIRYDSLLEGLYLTEQIHAWSSNQLNRLARSPKRYLIDPAFLGPLLGIDSRAVLRSADLMGRVVDSFVVAQLRPELEVCLPGVTMSHLRQQDGGHEVDLILEASDGRVVAIEIKAGSTPDLSDAKHLIWLRDKIGDQFVTGVVFHTGSKVFTLAEGIQALPISTIWS
jgi:uncharacterized protein